MFLANAGRKGQVEDKKFLYGRKGPWPQPSPLAPLGTSPEVLHLPWQEDIDWRLHIGLRYIRDIFLYSPVAAVRALGFRQLPEVADADFASALTRGLYSRFLSKLDPPDIEAFTKAHAYDPSDGAEYFKIDFTPIAGVDPFPGMYVSPTISLLRRPTQSSTDFTVLAISVGNDRLVLTPKNGDAWQLAKYYVLQGCSYATLFTEHPNVHFPYDTVNAITKGAIPTEHLLFKLLYPHLRFSLVLNNAVLESPASVISNLRHAYYDPFTARASDGLMAFFIAGYKGLEHNSAYPGFKYPANETDLRLPPTKYGEFLLGYFAPFLELATTVVDAMPETELGFCEEWARWIRVWIPTFPLLHFRHVDAARVKESRAKLAFALANMMWDVTVVHSTDHADFAWNIPVDWKCFRLRQPPPASTTGTPLDRKKLSRKIDIFKSTLAHRMFFAPTNVTRLVDVDYAFPNDALRAAQNTFKERLRAIDAGLEAKKIKRYLAVDEFAASIQY